jgi:hypothetical protein
MALFEIYQAMCDTEVYGETLFEMANLHKSKHGIDDVVIWVGKANKQHGLRVKVSNVKNMFDPNDCFVIQMPQLDYNHKAVANWITSKKLQEVLAWIKLNQHVLYDYENGVIDDTDEFLKKLSKV